MAATDQSISSNLTSSLADDDRQRGKKDERSEVESSERSCYTSNCQCWVIPYPYKSGARERREDADPLGRRERLPRLYFVPHSNTPKVKLLGTFSSTLPWNFEDREYHEWYDYLAAPGDDMAHISPPLPPPSAPSPAATSTISLPLFSLTRYTRVPSLVDDSGESLGGREYGDVGISYSLPVHPPPSKQIPSQQHPLPTNVVDGKMVGSCNGLYCVRSEMGDSVIVWNPTTGMFRELPPCRGSDHGLIYGFGYDQSSHDYKVVRINARTLLVEVFSLYNSHNSSWRTVQGFGRRCRDFQGYFYNGAVSFAGCLNWLVSVGTTMVASFDLATERFQFLPLPPTYGTGAHSLETSSLWILDGCLSFVSSHVLSRDCGLKGYGCRPRVLDIWIMREYGIESSWTNAATIAFPHYVGFPYRVLYLSKDVLILDIQHSGLFVFNIKENSLLYPHIRGRGRAVEPYVQSQVSPHCRSTGREIESGEEGEYKNGGLQFLRDDQLLLKDDFDLNEQPVSPSSPGTLDHNCYWYKIDDLTTYPWEDNGEEENKNGGQLLLKDEFDLIERVWASSPGMVVCNPSYSKIDGYGLEISYPWTADDEPGRRLMFLKVNGIYPARLVAPSVNGLICVTDYAPRPAMVLCNPSTGESLALPVPPAHPWSFYKFGFGYSPSTDEYKCVQLCLQRKGEWDADQVVSNRVIDCRVLTLGLSSPHHDQHQPQQRSTADNIDSSPWRRIEHPFGQDGIVVDGLHSGSVCVDGVIYWSGFTISPPSHGRRTPPIPKLIHWILSFNVRDEIFTTFPPPPPPTGKTYCSRHLTEVQGRLAVVGLTQRSRLDYEFDVWMLKGPGIWNRHLQIGFDMEELDLDDYELRQSTLHFDFSCLSRDKFIVFLNHTWFIYDLESESFVRRSRFMYSYGTVRPVSSPIKESFLSLR